MTGKDEPDTAVQAADGKRDVGQSSFGIIAIGGAALVVPLLAAGVAYGLGMSYGSADNDGIGSPLTTEEVRSLIRSQAESQESSSPNSGTEGLVTTIEEAAEEQALVDILQGGIRRAR